MTLCVRVACFEKCIPAYRGFLARACSRSSVSFFANPGISAAGRFSEVRSSGDKARFEPFEHLGLPGTRGGSPRSRLRF
jgi:hypothetical protein